MTSNHDSQGSDLKADTLNFEELSHNFSFDEAFKEHEDYNTFIFSVYDKIYDLPKITKQFDVSESFLRKIKKKKRFILLAPYDKRGEVFLTYHYTSSIGLSLLGGSIERKETIYDALKRTINGLCNSLDCRDFEPIAKIEHVFNGVSTKFIQEGVVFGIRVLNKKSIIEGKIEGDFFPITQESIQQVNRLSNKEVLLKCKERFEEFLTEFPDKEVSINGQYKNRYVFHNAIVKRFFLTRGLKRTVDFENLIRNEIGSAKSIIDVSCGENSLLCKLAPQLSFAVGNDICWSQIELLLQQKTQKSIVYTNHNSSYLPFKSNSFDVSLCMNTLHHMQSKEDLILLLESMFKVSRSILIVEIEDPKKTGGFPRLLNKYYYQGFLKDVGGAYLEEKNFRRIITERFKDRAQITFKNFKNIQGNYMIAKITKGD